jgi:pimeloyl-ACP methyl ester carboxylesterase
MNPALTTLLISLLAASGLAVTPAQAADDVTSDPVSFSVVNRNRTLVTCVGDGRTHQLRGRLVTPSSGDGSGRVNVLVHDITAGGWFWHLREHPAYDYASRLAERGETSLVLDRLGYDYSPLSNGRKTCLGAQATMLHQVVAELRRGGAEEIVLHGHSVGAAVAELEAATFRDVDGLVLMSWSDSGASLRAITEAAEQHTACMLSRDGYAPYGATAATFQELLFATAPDDVRATATALRNPDPCGDAFSLSPLLVINNVMTRLIDVPVLLLFGERDALNRPDASRLQPLAYSPTAEVTSYVVPGAGSALPLEASAAQTRERVLDWLSRL